EVVGVVPRGGGMDLTLVVDLEKGDGGQRSRPKSPRGSEVENLGVEGFNILGWRRKDYWGGLHHFTPILTEVSSTSPVPPRSATTPNAARVLPDVGGRRATHLDAHSVMLLPNWTLLVRRFSHPPMPPMSPGHMRLN